MKFSKKFKSSLLSKQSLGMNVAGKRSHHFAIYDIVCPDHMSILLKKPICQNTDRQ